LGEILKAYAKEVISQQPENIFEFSARYFTLLDQLEEEFEDGSGGTEATRQGLGAVRSSEVSSVESEYENRLRAAESARDKALAKLVDVERELLNARALVQRQEPRQAGCRGAINEDHTGKSVQSGLEDLEPDNHRHTKQETYLQNLIDILKRSKEGATADAAFLEVLSKQLEVLHSLEAVLAARLRSDPKIEVSPSTAEADPDDKAGVTVRREVRLRFDSRVDDDEVLLLLFEVLDDEKSGSIKLEKLLRLMRSCLFQCPS